MKFNFIVTYVVLAKKNNFNLESESRAILEVLLFRKLLHEAQIWGKINFNLESVSKTIYEVSLFNTN